MSERIRLNLVVNRQVKDRVDRLQALSDAASITEVVRRALIVYEELLKVHEGGRRIVIEGDDEREFLRII